MKSFLQQAVDRYEELAGPKFHNLKKVATPFHDDKIARPVETEAEVKGELAPIASRVLMKLLFAARMARYDLLRAVQGLASRVTKWSSECDKSLHRLMCYVNSTLDVKLRSYIGDSVDQCRLWLFADADHAGKHDNKRTSGTPLALVGPNTYFPLSAFSKKQASISISSTEAEVVCANIALRTVGLPSSAIWSLLQKAVGDTAQHSASKKVPSKLPFKDFPDKMVVESTLPYGRTMMIDGRIAILSEKPKHIPEPVELTKHPLRDVWLLPGGKWNRTEEAVAWEDLIASTYSFPSGVDACLCIYGKSSSDLRRHAEAEATLHRESYALRHATDDYCYSPIGPEGDSSLILSAPHSIQPVVLEDNQATIRIMESGKSPAFRHADKTQRINLGWLSEQFRRKHYVLAHISTSLQAADILTKPFTNADKWRHAVRLLGHGIIKPDSRSAAAPSTTASTSDARRRSPR